MNLIRSLAPLIALCIHAVAADFTTGKLFDAAALLPAPREEFFLTPQGRPDWMFAEPVNRVTPAVVGTLSAAEGRAEGGCGVADDHFQDGQHQEFRWLRAGVRGR